MSTAIEHTPLTDYEWEVADRLSLAMERAGARGITPSEGARKARVDLHLARRLLAVLVERQFAHTSGNGARTRYHDGRAR